MRALVQFEIQGLLGFAQGPDQTPGLAQRFVVQGDFGNDVRAKEMEPGVGRPLSEGALDCERVEGELGGVIGGPSEGIRLVID